MENIDSTEKTAAEFLAARDLEFYEHQAHKEYDEVLEAFSRFCPAMPDHIRRKVASRICKSHKQGHRFTATVPAAAESGRLEIFTISLSENAPTYVEWESVRPHTESLAACGIVPDRKKKE